MARRTFLLVDGENIDATLGFTILKHTPRPAERPRWERVLEFAAGLWNQEATGLFFLNIKNGTLPGPFVSALQEIGFRPVPLTGPPTQKVVDEGIVRTLAALRGREADVLLASHDRDFVDAVRELLDEEHRVALLGFTELMSGAWADLDVEVHDLERDAHAFNEPLPRVRIIPLDEFRPEDFLY